MSNRFADSKISIGTHEIQTERHADADKQDWLVQERVLFVKESRFLPAEVFCDLTRVFQKPGIEDDVIVWNKRSADPR